ncbi:hypothetical protein [Actinokineospora inagensis]|uniref:hypothetical protein n=1 Tax=Actinokineospora inagensis TaxID=103730 RepID=UPI0003F6523F|nr:hypothetical protein [Actinokineospora inagensis]
MTTGGPEYDAPPPVQTASAPRAARPRAVTAAFALLVLEATLNLVILVLVVSVGRDGFRAVSEQVVRDSGKPVTAANVDSLMTSSFTTALVLALVPCVVYGLFGFPLRSGRNWARNVVSIVAVVHVVLLGLNLVSGGSGLTLVFNALQLLLLGTVVYFLYTKDAKDYFEAGRRTGHPS